MNGLDRMTAIQRSVAEAEMVKESAQRRHVVVHLSGAHAYGFPSVDSDLDLKAIHIAPTASLLGFEPDLKPAQRLEFVNEVEVDYTSNELGSSLRTLLRGDGNMLERFASKFPLMQDPLLAEMRTLIPGCLSKQFFRHYRGFASSQRKHLVEAEAPSAKKLLYVLRTALTGAHLLLEHDCEPDLLELYARYGFEEVPELVHLKESAERGALPEPWRERATKLVERAFGTLTAAHEESTLPESATGAAELEAWLIEARKAAL